MEPSRTIVPRKLKNPRTHCEDCGTRLSVENAYRRHGATTFRSRCRPCYTIDASERRRRANGSLPRSVCDICRRPERATRNGRVRLLTRDHDHSTGAWRGLLCSSCNVAIGLLQDDPAVMRAAAEYIENPPGI